MVELSPRLEVPFCLPSEAGKPERLKDVCEVADEPVVVSKARPMADILLLQYLHFHHP